LPYLKKHELKASRSKSKTSNYSSVSNVTAYDKQTIISAAALATTSSISTANTKLSGMKLHPKKYSLRASRIKSNTSDYSSAANVGGDDKQTNTFSESPTTITSASTVNAELSEVEIELHPKQYKLKASYTQTDTNDNSSATNVNGDDKETTTFATLTSKSTTTAELSDTELSGIEPHNASATNVTAVEINQSSTTSEPASFTNNYQMFLNIRKQVNWLFNNIFNKTVVFIFIR